MKTQKINQFTTLANRARVGNLIEFLFLGHARVFTRIVDIHNEL
jgi:hypothetical protein